jgi:hypothetical protein
MSNDVLVEKIAASAYYLDTGGSEWSAEWPTGGTRRHFLFDAQHAVDCIRACGFTLSSPEREEAIGDLVERVAGDIHSLAANQRDIAIILETPR